MIRWKLAGSIAATALLMGTVSFAQVTPEDIWQNWQDVSTSYGQTIQVGNAVRDGDTLVVTELAISAENKDGSKLAATIPEMRFKDNGDGTVGITMSDSYTIVMNTVDITDGGPEKIDTTINSPGLVMMASGTPDATDYEFSAPMIEAVFTAHERADTTVSAIDGAIKMTNSSGNWSVSAIEGGKKIDQEFVADRMDFTLHVTETATGDEAGVTPGNMTLTASATTITSSTSGNFVGTDLQDLTAALRAGFSFDGGLDYVKANYEIVATDDSGPSKLTGKSDGGHLQMAMDAAKIMFSAGGKGVALEMVSGLMPEFSLSYAESALSFMMPISKSDTPQDFSLLLKVVDLVVSDDVWGMIDPVGQLPHDPATLIIDASGKARLTTDLGGATGGMADIGNASPGELHALDLNTLQLKVAGAVLTGTGNFTFDNSDMITFDGIPAPTGKADLKLTGGNTLMDKLMAMGLLSEEDVMGARMMLSMFANQSAGVDELTSTLEIKDKHIFANGQQLQ